MERIKDESGRFVSPNPEPLAAKALSVRLPVSLDEEIRKMPNYAAWVRAALRKQLQAEKKQKA